MYVATGWLTRLLIACGIASILFVDPSFAERLEYEAPPIDNPLKGIVPYAGATNHRFPHSLEFRYFAFRDVLVGQANDGEFQFDWTRLEEFLDEVHSRGNQGVFRLHCEYPESFGKEQIKIPGFLVERGVEVTRVRATDSTDSQGRPTTVSMTPDYESLQLRHALVETIAAMGAKYDGDPRIGFIEVGTLGFWGEWHTYPSTDRMASRHVQNEVLQAFEDGFRKTKLLARYPVGDSRANYTSNVTRNVGYHDDSFTWSTRCSGDASWHFMSQMVNANATNKWKTNPIGGELYPQLNEHVFEETCEHNGKSASDFIETVNDTHASYMRLWAVFEEGLSGDRRIRAEEAVRRMGYDLHFREASVEHVGGNFELTAELENHGVAPFYYNWPLTVGLLDAAGKTIQEWSVDWRIDGVVPGDARVFRATLSPDSDAPEGARVAVRVANPMKGGRPLRFSNATQQSAGPAWMVLGRLDSRQAK